MANTTFKGPVRSQSGFDLIKKSITTGSLTTNIALECLETSITVANGDTTGTSTAVIPTNFVVLQVTVAVTSAATNAVNLTDLGTAVDPDAYLDGMTISGMNAAGFKGIFVANGANGLVALGGGTTASTAAPATLTATMGDPGAAGCTIKVKLLGFSSDSDTE